MVRILKLFDDCVDVTSTPHQNLTSLHRFLANATIEGYIGQYRCNVT